MKKVNLAIINAITELVLTADVENAVQMYFNDNRKIQAVLMPESFREQ